MLGNEGVWDPNFVEKRGRVVLPFGDAPPLSQFVALHVTPRPPALYNRITGYNTSRVETASLVLFVTNARLLAEHLVPLVVSTWQPLSAGGTFKTILDGLDAIDWSVADSNDFRRDPNDPHKISRRGAEVLAHRAIPLAAISEIVCATDTAELRRIAAAAGIADDLIHTRPSCFFAQPSGRQP